MDFVSSLSVLVIHPVRLCTQNHSIERFTMGIEGCSMLHEKDNKSLSQVCKVRSGSGADLGQLIT